MKITFIKVLPIALLANSLIGCGSATESSVAACDIDQFNMAIQTIAPNYGASSAVALGCSSEATITDSLFTKEDSDYTVSSGKSSVYHIGRSGVDTVAKYQFSSSSLQDWEYSTNNANEEISSNPYKFIEASENKAYIIRYNKASIWIVNPAATNSEDFKIGEIDLSHYLGDGETSVNMSDAIISNNKLFVAMQRIGSSYNFSNDSKVAVFNIETDQEIDTSPSDTENEKAITLNGHNVSSLTTQGSIIYTASRGNYSNDYGILESINIDNYQLETVIEGSETLGHITNSAVISAQKIYVLSDYSASINGTYTYQYNLFEFDSINNSIVTHLSEFTGTNISDIELGPEGNLWIASAENENPGVYKIDVANNTKIAFIETILNPTKIVFAK